MPLDLSGFDSGVNQYGGLYKLGDDLRQNRELDLRKQQMDLAQKRFDQNEADRQATRKNATANYLKSYLSPDHFLTGTVYDPLITKGIGNVMNKAMQLAAQGVDAATISTLINPDVAKLSQASQNLQQINAQAENAKKILAKQPGFDASKFDDEFKKNTYFTTDANGNTVLKDISKLDPNQDYADQTVRNGNVWNNQAIDDFLKNTKPLVYSSQIKDRDKTGRLTDVKGDISAPAFMIPNTDAQGAIIKENGRPSFVPKYDIATDGESALVHDFMGDNQKAPVRIVSDDIWQHTPDNVKAYVLQEVRSHLKGNPNIKMTDPQAEILGKAILYDELKNNPYNGGSFKQVSQNIQPLPPRVSVHINNGKGSDTPTIDIYTPLEQKLEESKANKTGVTTSMGHIIGSIPTNSLDEVTQGVIMSELKTKYGDRYTPADIYIAQPRDNAGQIGIYDASTNQPLMSISKKGAALGANKSLGIKSKQKAVENSGGMSDDEFKNFLKKNGLTK